MKNSWQILTLLLAVALVVLSIKVVLLNDNNDKDESVNSVNTEDIVLNNIMTRSSVRSYTAQKVEDDKVQKLIKAGMAAPTAANKQPWEILVINERAVLDSLPSIIPGSHMAAKAPLALVVLGSPSKALLPDYWVQDCSAMTENILLAAHGMGLGAVWCGAYPENGTGRVETISKLFNLPEGTYALNVIVIGYPNSEPIIKDKFDANKVHYNKY